MPRNLVQAFAFLFGLWLALSVWPFGARGEPQVSRSPQGREAAAQRGEAERSVGSREGGKASEDHRGASSYADLEASLHRGVNDARKARHLIPLERRADLDAVALAHSRDMVARRYFAHESPDGHNALNRLTNAKVAGFSLAAENIGITDRPDPNREILSAWIESEVHRTNLFSPPFNATGIGIARAPNGSLVYTQVYVTYPR